LLSLELANPTSSPRESREFRSSTSRWSRDASKRRNRDNPADRGSHRHDKSCFRTMSLSCVHAHLADVSVEFQVFSLPARF
ncbi:hypothetical protein X777_07530, partial [Ooceraea biroi]